MKDFKQYMTPDKRGHLIGIGGVSMSPLAEVLRGMGLSIVKGLMEEAGGSVSVTSDEAETTFSGALPRPKTPLSREEK